MEDGHKALKIAQEFSDNSMISIASSHLSLGYSWKGDLDKAVEYGELGIQKAPTIGDKTRAHRSLGWALCRAGELKRGIKLLNAAISPISQRGAFMAFETPLSCYLGEGYWLAGQEEKARQTLEKGLKMAESYGMKYYLGFAHRILGEIAMKKKMDQAVRHLEKSIAIFGEIRAENELAMAYAGIGHLHRQESQFKRARKYLMQALKIFERLGTLIEPDKVREELAKLPEQ
jgi:tetratricopeptide (TPR) repeat protein